MDGKIVIITGSPRKNGNTAAMAAAFVRTAEKRGYTVVRFDAAQMNLGGCHACKTCYSTGKACTFDDDFNRIAPEIESSDAVIFAMPVYWYSIPAQIKCVIDKMYSLYTAQRPVAGKRWGLLTCCGDHRLSVMDGVRIPMERAAKLLGWKLAGEVLIPGVSEIGDIQSTSGLEQASALAERI